MRFRNPRLEEQAGSTGIEGYGDPAYGPTPHLGGPTGPLSVTGATGPAPVYSETNSPLGQCLFGPTGAAHPHAFRFREGETYAYRLDGRDFFATGRIDGSTGFLELTEVANPYTGEGP